MDTYYGLSGLSGNDISHFVSTVNRSLREADAELTRRIRKQAESLDEDAEAARGDLRNRAEELARLLAGRLLGREMAS